VLVKLHINVVDLQQDSHSISHAQLISEQLIARVMPVTGHPKNALSATTVNSQMLRAAMMLAVRK